MEDNQAVTCEDCKDFDLCIECLRNSEHGHDPSHKLARAHENVHLSKAEEGLLARGRNVRHEALCDNCDNVGILPDLNGSLTNRVILGYSGNSPQVC